MQKWYILTVPLWYSQLVYEASSSLARQLHPRVSISVPQTCLISGVLTATLRRRTPENKHSRSVELPPRYFKPLQIDISVITRVYHFYSEEFYLLRETKTLLRQHITCENVSQIRHYSVQRRQNLILLTSFISRREERRKAQGTQADLGQQTRDRPDPRDG